MHMLYFHIPVYILESFVWRQSEFAFFVRQLWLAHFFILGRKKMKKVLSMTLMLCILMSLLAMMPATVSAAVVDSGTCGENLTWTLDDTGTLTIRGTGGMLSNPWRSKSNSVKKVVIESGVTVIGDGAFSLCYYLADVTIPNSVTAIGDRAFYQCSSLTKITIPDSVTIIGAEAFYRCSSLTNITIPSSVATIGDGAFASCEIKDIIVDEVNVNYLSVNDVLYNKNKTILIQYPTGKADASFVIPDSVTTIGDYAFEGCESLESIAIPESVTTIGENAFNSTAYYNDMSNWEDYNFLYIGKHLIKAHGNDTDYSIKEGTKSIAGGAFEWWTDLSSVTIPESVMVIGNRAFANCDELTTIYYAGTEQEWNAVSKDDGGILPTTSIICLPKFECRFNKGNNQISTTLAHKNLPSGTVFLAATYDENGKILEIKPVTIEQTATFKATDVKDIKVFAWGDYFSPVIQNVIETIE